MKKVVLLDKDWETLMSNFENLSSYFSLSLGGWGNVSWGYCGGLSQSLPLLYPPGRGSDSESDAGPHGGRKLPDVRKDDMLARRTSVSEPRVMVPFNQYLPNKSNASGYVPTPLRRKRGDHEGREEGSGRGGGSRKSWSTATSPIGGDIPFR